MKLSSPCLISLSFAQTWQSQSWDLVAGLLVSPFGMLVSVAQSSSPLDLPTPCTVQTRTSPALPRPGVPVAKYLCSLMAFTSFCSFIISGGTSSLFPSASSLLLDQVTPRKLHRLLAHQIPDCRIQSLRLFTDLTGQPFQSTHTSYLNS